jgi:hypothetical protein
VTLQRGVVHFIGSVTSWAANPEMLRNRISQARIDAPMASLQNEPSPAGIAGDGSFCYSEQLGLESSVEGTRKAVDA